MVVPSGDGITATVAEREFLGGFTRYRMQAGGNVVVVDVPHRAARRRTRSAAS